MSDREREHGRLFWAATAAGWATIAFGVWTLLQRSGATRPLDFTTWLIGLALVHDLVFAPIVAGLAVILGTKLTPRMRGAVIGGLIVSGAIVLVSLPPLLGARLADNPSLLPRAYGTGLVVALGLTWAAVLGIAIAARRRASRGGP